MRLTADLILRSAAYINPLQQRELDLRGNKIPFIENLGATQDQYESLDFTDNEIGKLDNFPLMKRLQTLLLSNNRICKIGNSLNTALPNLHTLVLTKNNLSNLEDLEPLACLSSLTSLSLIDNPVARNVKYRLFVVHLLPKLKVLDFRRIRIKEKRAARELFGNTSEERTERSQAPQQTEEERQAIRKAIERASTLEEAQRLEVALESGKTPLDILRQLEKPEATENGLEDNDIDMDD